MIIFACAAKPRRSSTKRTSLKLLPSFLDMRGCGRETASIRGHADSTNSASSGQGCPACGGGVVVARPGRAGFRAKGAGPGAAAPGPGQTRDTGGAIAGGPERSRAAAACDRQSGSHRRTRGRDRSVAGAGPRQPGADARRIARADRDLRAAAGRCRHPPQADRRSAGLRRPARGSRARDRTHAADPAPRRARQRTETGAAADAARRRYREPHHRAAARPVHPRIACAHVERARSDVLDAGRTRPPGRDPQRGLAAAILAELCARQWREQQHGRGRAHACGLLGGRLAVPALAERASACGPRCWGRALPRRSSRSQPCCAFRS